MKTPKKPKILEAEQDYLAGMKFPELAKKYCVAENTVRSWYRRYGWGDSRAEIQRKIDKTLYERLEEKVTESTENYLAGALLVGKVCVRVLELLVKKPRENATEINKWVNIMYRGAQVQKLVTPEAPEMLMEQVLDELKRINGDSGNNGNTIVKGRFNGH